MILTEGTVHIAAGAAHGQDEGPREKTAQRLFLNGIQRQRSELPIGIRNHLAILVVPDSAKACRSLLQTAVMRADWTDRLH